jgi:ATP-binding cassette, subfamily B, bacterial PglK
MAEEEHRYVESMSGFFAFKLLPRIATETLLVVFLIGFTSVFLLFNQDIKELTAVLSIFSLASIRLIPAFSNLVTGISSLKKYSFTLNKLYNDIKELEKLEKDKSTKVASSDYRKATRELNFSKEIVLDAVTYGYPNASGTALNSISMRIAKGSSIAFIGKSGAGKTTLVDVILGLLVPQSGDIKVDGESVYEDLRSWQNLIGYIPQSIFLTDETIERNIAFGVSDHLIDQERLKKAIKAAQLEELIERLPQGTQTMVGERGVLLSGGQRQRIGIARALYHEREILILDEATAALDNETESLITEAMQSLSGQKTLIIIAHRLTTIKDCNRVYELQKGQIVKEGTYQELVEEQAIH